jgi:serine/threonine-protein kinase
MNAIGKLDLHHLIGRKVGSSTLLKELARGGMGVVFIAYQSTLKRQIAVKILPKSIITPTSAKVFQQEAEAAAILSHPNIIPIYEVGESDDFLYITMQLIKGHPLSHYIKRAHKHVLPSRRTIPVKAALNIMISVLDALEYAHEQDIIHRDIKPGNILIEGHTGRPIVMDFGVAQVTKNSEEDASMIVGTPIYMAPEQITNPEVDGRADLYATAMMLLQMLIPAPLFSGIRSAKKLMEMKLERKDDLIPEMPSRLNKGVNQEMDRILSKALSFSPETRYTRCQDFRKQLTSYMDRYLTN